ncbi:MAG: hypothetical protein U5K51_02400 [Flavobacteriaceae bacterium]|nr:hypothetical protein [Flavobacteriaceae bacterium]
MCSLSSGRKRGRREKFAVVASARGNATDDLLEILELAKTDGDYLEKLAAFKKYQSEPDKQIDLEAEFSLLKKLSDGVNLLGDYSQKIRDRVIAQGELISVKMLAGLLQKEGIAGQPG